MILSKMSFIPRVAGGAALRTRSDDSDVEWWKVSIPLWPYAALALIVGIVYLFRKYDICEGLGL